MVECRWRFILACYFIVALLDVCCGKIVLSEYKGNGEDGKAEKNKVNDASKVNERENNQSDTCKIQVPCSMLDKQPSSELSECINRIPQKRQAPYCNPNPPPCADRGQQASISSRGRGKQRPRVVPQPCSPEEIGDEADCMPLPRYRHKGLPITVPPIEPIPPIPGFGRSNSKQGSFYPQHDPEPGFPPTSPPIEPDHPFPEFYPPDRKPGSSYPEYDPEPGPEPGPDYGPKPGPEPGPESDSQCKKHTHTFVPYREAIDVALPKDTPCLCPCPCTKK